jgi:drug/metabolite transporter (DMT)-like permease
MTRAAPLICLASAVVIWATTFVVSSSALATTSPAVLTVLRFALAAIVLVPLALRRGGLGGVFLAPITAALGLTGVAAYYGLQNLGLLQTPAGTAALLQAVLPVATAVLAAVLLGERQSGGAVAGLVAATVGVALVASSGARFDRGAALVVAGVLAYALYTVLLRRLGSAPRNAETAGTGHSTSDAVVLAAATASWGLVFLIPWLVWEIASGKAELPASPTAVAETLYLGVVASGGTLLLWTYGAARTPASLSGILTAGIPALGYAFAVLAGEPATWAKTTGGILAVAGVLLATYAATRSARARLPVRPPRPSRRSAPDGPLT